MIKTIRVDAKVIPIEAGTYILIYNPRDTSIERLMQAMISLEETAPECRFVMIPTYDPDSIRLLKTEIPITLEKRK